MIDNTKKKNGYVIVQSPHIYDILMFLYEASFFFNFTAKKVCPSTCQQKNFIIRQGENEIIIITAITYFFKKQIN